MEEMVHINFQVPISVKKFLKHQAVDKGQTLSGLMREITEKYLSTQDYLERARQSQVELAEEATDVH